jgi:hypothetical protein
MIQDQVDADADALFAAGAGGGLEILHRAVDRVDLAVIHDRIAAVVVPRTGLQAGHEMDVVDAKVLQVGDLPRHLVQMLAEPVDVEDVPRHVGPLEPVGFEVAFQVQKAQVVGPFRPGRAHLAVERVAERRIARMPPVEPLQHGPEVAAAPLVPEVEQRVVEIGSCGCRHATPDRTDKS